MSTLAKFDPFNSLSRDHQEGVRMGQRSQQFLSTPSLGITEDPDVVFDKLEADFQLPLSGSRYDSSRILTLKRVSAFNSLSRDHETIKALGFRWDAAGKLSTPSLGITYLSSSRYLARNLVIFQLPLSGSHQLENSH